jgi:hypothetical protein
MFSLSISSDSTNLTVPKLRDNGSNWSNYQLQVQKAMGAKALWRHVKGKATAPILYALVSGIPVLSDGKTPATEEQIEVKEARSIDFEKREYLAQHIILSTTSTRLGTKIKDMKTAKEMWDTVKVDATTKSTLYLIDADSDHCRYGCTCGFCSRYSHRYRYGYENWYLYPYPYLWLYPSCLGKVSVAPQPQQATSRTTVVVLLKSK